jgi:hypothetical protein
MESELLNDDIDLQHLYVSYMTYAATSEGYRMALVVACSAAYAEEVLKEKLAARFHQSIETIPLPPKEANIAGRKTISVMVPDEARVSLYKVGASKGFYFAELYYSLSS